LFHRKERQGRKGLKIQDQSFDSVPQFLHVEIEPQSQLAARQLQVRQYLCVMNWHKPINSLDLYNYPVSNHQIRPRATVKPYFLVHDWDQLLTLNRYISQRQLISQALFVCRLQ